ncbi:hypothetical protein SSCG_03838 [Streptomyces clavuligerus]|nr:hypothetical protein SSCG_03838 [Streptomyces clavuligerus]
MHQASAEDGGDALGPGGQPGGDRSGAARALRAPEEGGPGSSVSSAASAT